MICQPTDIELETVINRIKNEDINLQPDFQRGEVWGDNRKKKLVDSLLRGWKIPPIHVISGENNIDEVLDGQQRLIAISDFFDNKIKIDGGIQPKDPNIEKLDGKYYKDLPIDIQRQLRRYSITLIRLSDYKAEEPAELFYRLNQPATLTAAEQRNAYVGETRNQIKNLVTEFEDMGAKKEIIGFSNSRLAYDEIISKFAYMIEINSLKRKITAGDISKKYRDSEPYTDEAMNIVKEVLLKYIGCMNGINEKYIYTPKHSKATIVSWFIYLAKRVKEYKNDDLEYVMYGFEYTRDYLKRKLTVEDVEFEIRLKNMLDKYPYIDIMLNIYNQRASMGSTDALSVIYRDIIINIYEQILINPNSELLREVEENFTKTQNMNSVLENINSIHQWGNKIL